MKQETLEEVAEKYYESNIDQSNIPREHYEREIQDFMCGFANQWQAERSYSAAEVKDIAKDAYTMGRNNILIGVFNKWVNQFKKKP